MMALVIGAVINAVTSGAVAQQDAAPSCEPATWGVVMMMVAFLVFVTALLWMFFRVGER